MAVHVPRVAASTVERWRAWDGRLVAAPEEASAYVSGPTAALNQGC
jgi:hypothetical protein